MKNLPKSLLILSFCLCFSSNSSAQLTINSQFGDLTECDTMSRDIFIIWWDNDVDFSKEVDQLLDSMVVYKNILLNTYKMQNPPNPGLGHFVNVYVHRPNVAKDFFSPQKWGNGVGQEGQGAHFTLPNDLLENYFNAAHETAHIFQFESNSAGFNANKDGEWYFEASAEWFALIRYPNFFQSHITSRCLTRLPHVPLWFGWANYPTSYPKNWQREGHQYGLATFLYYLTEVEGVTRSTIMNGFYANKNETPQEYLYKTIGGSTLRQYFINFAARITNNFDFISAVQNLEAETEWSSNADQKDDNEFVKTLTNTGTNGWFRPANNKTTNAWSFNTIKLENTLNTSYTFELKGDATGNFGDTSFFQGKIIVKNANTGTTFHDIKMTNKQEGSITLPFQSSDTEIDLVIASMPTYFVDTNTNFQLFPYEVRITKNSTTNIQNLNKEINDIEIFPCPAKNYITLKGDLNNYAIAIINSKGSVVRNFNSLNESKSIDISDIPRGAYLLRISNNGQLHFKHIIKK